MKCPVCTDVNLAMTDRQGIEIDYCPQCRGVWLDRGELDKLIERSGVAAAPAATRPPEMPQSRPPAFEQRDYEQRHHEQRPAQHRDSDYYKHKKKKNLLGELFDF